MYLYSFYFLILYLCLNEIPTFDVFIAFIENTSMKHSDILSSKRSERHVDLGFYITHL